MRDTHAAVSGPQAQTGTQVTTYTTRQIAEALMRARLAFLASLERWDYEGTLLAYGALDLLLDTKLSAA